MPGAIATIPKLRFTDASGAPIVGGTLTVYAAGTTTPENTWQDRALSILNTNPITLDGNGACVVWLDSAKSYKVVLKDSAGAVQWTQDNIEGGGVDTSFELSVAAIEAAITESQNWATQTGSDVTGAPAGSRSAKSWATDDLTPSGADLGGSAKDWATSTSLPDGANKSAKSYASDASGSATAAAASRSAVDNRIYPGTYAADPITRPNGSAIQNGDIYISSTSGAPKQYISGVWSLMTAASSADLANSTDLAKGSALVGHESQSLRLALNKARGLRALAESYPFELFDRPDGTLLNGITSTSGHTFSASGDVAATVSVSGGAMVAAGNVYTGLGASGLVTRVAGVFSFTGTPGANKPVIMFNGTGPTDLNKLIHLEVNGGGFTLKFTTTGAGALSAPTGTVRERNGRSDSLTLLDQASRGDGTPTMVAMEYTAGATDLDDVLSVFLPDGRILDYSGDTRIRGVMATCQWGTWQLTGAGCRWHMVSLGSAGRSQVLAAASGAARARDMVPVLGMHDKYRRGQSITFAPTASGWYKIADGITTDGYTSLVGRLRIFSRDNGGRYNALEMYVNCYQTVAPRIEWLTDGFGFFGGTHITKIRLSSSGSNAAKQLEIFVGTFTSAADRVTVEFEGAAALVSSPVIGSTALATSREVSTTDPRRGVRQEAAVATKTFTPGIDQCQNILINHYGAAVDFFVDDTKAHANDEFLFARAAGYANNANIKNTSDSSVVAILTPGTTARIGIIGGKFVVISKGTC